MARSTTRKWVAVHTSTFLLLRMLLPYDDLFYYTKSKLPSRDVVTAQP
jgi:hypothetical protein